MLLSGVSTQAEQEKERPGTQAPLSGRVRWMTAYLTKRLAAWTTLKQLYSQHQVSKLLHCPNQFWE